jgi:hypothetical protein
MATIFVLRLNGLRVMIDLEDTKPFPLTLTDPAIKARADLEQSLAGRLDPISMLPRARPTVHDSAPFKAMAKYTASATPIVDELRLVPGPPPWHFALGSFSRNPNTADGTLRGWELPDPDAEELLAASGYHIEPESTAVAPAPPLSATPAEQSPMADVNPPEPRLKNQRKSDADTAEDLTSTARKLLRALSKLKATDLAEARGRNEIADEAKVGNADSRHCRRAFDQLKSHGFIESKRGVGTWITRAGRTALKTRQ